MKNKSMLKNVCFFTLIIMLSYTSKGEIVKKSFKIENFTSISVQTGIQVKVIIDNNSDVAYAEGNDELMERLKVESNNGRLHIYYESEYGSRSMDAGKEGTVSYPGRDDSNSVSGRKENAVSGR